MEEIFYYKGSFVNDDVTNVQRFGMVIGLRPELMDSYAMLHKYAWPEVLDAINKGNIRNYSIFLHEINGDFYLFGYYEYIGANYDSDMKKIDNDPATIAWIKFTDKVCQNPLPTREEGEWWASMKNVLTFN